MSDGNSMNELQHFGSFDAVWGYVNHTKPISERYSASGYRSRNAGRIPLAERRYVDRYWCRKGVRKRSRKTKNGRRYRRERSSKKENEKKKKKKER